MRPFSRIRWIAGVLLALTALTAAACAADTSKDEEIAALKQQLASQAPVNVVQAGQLAPATSTQPTGWDTAESIRGGLKLVAQYDSSGPDAWDVRAHPLVYVTSEGMGYGHRPSETNKLPGVQVIDANTYEVVASALFDLPGEPSMNPHGSGVSPDGRWAYIGTRQKLESGENQALTLVINLRTLKLDKTLMQESLTGWNPRQERLHHISAFTSWEGRGLVALQYGFGATGGPGFLLDPKDDNRVWRAITYENVRPQGHPFYTTDPSGKFLYVSMGANWIREAESKSAGMAKVNLETGAVTVIEGVGNHPIGSRTTADGKYTYVVDGSNSLVFKIDNETNHVVGHTSAGVAGPYGMFLNWDETELWTVGKGEGSHNTGGDLGVIDLKTFRPTRDFNQPVRIGGATMDHAIVHPDPNRNEVWVSSAGTWETIVVDLGTREVKARIPSPNGGDTHNGAFVRFDASWNGTLLADQAGPKAELNAIRLAKITAMASAKP